MFVEFCSHTEHLKKDNWTVWFPFLEEFYIKKPLVFREKPDKPLHTDKIPISKYIYILLKRCKESFTIYSLYLRF